MSKFAAVKTTPNYGPRDDFSGSTIHILSLHEKSEDAEAAIAAIPQYTDDGEPLYDGVDFYVAHAETPWKRIHFALPFDDDIIPY